MPILSSLYNFSSTDLCFLGVFDFSIAVVSVLVPASVLSFAVAEFKVVVSPCFVDASLCASKAVVFESILVEICSLFSFSFSLKSTSLISVLFRIQDRTLHWP